MKYYCYISEHKVDMLLQQIENSVIDTTTEEKIVERQKSANPGVGNLLGLFSLGVSFGKSDRINVSRVQREGLVQKLRRAMIGLAAEQNIPDLKLAVKSLDSIHLTSLYYFYEGKFYVRSYDESLARLRSTLSDNHTLELVCSMKYFSDLAERNGKFTPHSGNVAFFEGQIKPTLSGIIIVEGADEGVIHGSPLYLALEPTGRLNL